MTGLLFITTFLSSFLLFTIQLIVGKRILPWFGGAASVWTTSMLFFMIALFLGYLYVNQISRYSQKRQVKIHLTLIGISLLSVLINYFWHKTLIFPSPIFHSFSPIIQILSLISFSVGIPFFLLSTTSTLLQHWFTYLAPKKNPYSLYVVSNIGSLLGLLSYPLIIEPVLLTTAQESLWLILFCVYLFLTLKIILLFNSPHIIVKSKLPSFKSVTLSEMIPWLGLSIVSNTALLATTSSITQAISPVPLLWIFPLAIFLITFIIAFSGSKWYSRDFHGSLMIFSIVIMALITNNKIIVSYWFQLGTILFTLFIINLVCHAELYLSKPNPKSLVPFYVTISFGGVLASILCAVVAPLYFKELWELPLSLILSSLVFMLAMFFQPHSLYLKAQYILISILVIILILFQFDGILLKYTTDFQGTLKIIRNFYGVLYVTKTDYAEANLVSLLNGKILHGTQNFKSGFEFEPTTYYTRDSGVGAIIDNNAKRLAKKSMRIGVIGLGTGTMSAYCLPGDYFRFYEINPNVIDISNMYFTYISHCKQIGGVVDVINGDARLSLQKEKKLGTLQKFDVLIVDAFTDDSIPVHLITNEALELYLSHLAPDGVIAFHISNLYLNLSIVIEQEVFSQNLYSYQYDIQGSQWYLVSPSPLKKPFEFYRIIPEKKLRLWTDDYSNIFQIIK